MVVHPVKSIEVPDVDFILKSPVATVVPGFADAFTEISTLDVLELGAKVSAVIVISSQNDKDINDIINKVFIFIILGFRIWYFYSFLFYLQKIMLYSFHNFI